MVQVLTSWAQNLEDVVLWRVLHDSSERVFVDVGAGDPSYDSVTALFSGNGWRGINIDPNPLMIERLRASRPNDTNVLAAVGDTPGSLTFWRGEGPAWGLSTLDPHTAATQRARGVRYIEERVEVRTLDDILTKELHRFGVATLGFLKVDVEGLEEHVLRGCSLDVWRPRVVVVEAIDAATHAPTHERFEHVLAAAGYESCLFDGLNRFYAHADDIQARERLAKGPASCLDNYRVAERPKPLLLGAKSPAAARVLCVPTWDKGAWKEQLAQIAAMPTAALEVVVLITGADDTAASEQVTAVRTAVGTSPRVKLVRGEVSGELLDRLLAECDGVLATGEDFVVQAARKKQLRIIGM